MALDEALEEIYWSLFTEFTRFIALSQIGKCFKNFSFQNITLISLQVIT